MERKTDRKKIFKIELKEETENGQYHLEEGSKCMNILREWQIERVENKKDIKTEFN